VAKFAFTFAVIMLIIGGIYLTSRLNNLSHERNVNASQKTQAQSSLSAAKSTVNAQASLADRGKNLASAVAAQCKEDDKYRRENPSLCTSAVNLATASPTLIPGPPGPPATTAQIQAAVDYYLSTHTIPIDYAKLVPFVNNWLASHSPAPGKPGPSGPSGPSGSSGLPGVSGASGQPGLSGPSGESGQPGINGSSGASGQNGQDGKDGISVTGIDASTVGNVVTLSFTMSDNTVNQVQFTLPNNCPATRTITPPDPGLAGTPGDPTEPYAVCVPSPTQ
jgi:hypothetical protein